MLPGAGIKVAGNAREERDSRRGTPRAEDAQGTPTQSHASPSVLVYEEQPVDLRLLV
jgi:hypothetical protein